MPYFASLCEKGKVLIIARPILFIDDSTNFLFLQKVRTDESVGQQRGGQEKERKAEDAGRARRRRVVLHDAPGRRRRRRPGVVRPAAGGQRRALAAGWQAGRGEAGGALGSAAGRHDTAAGQSCPEFFFKQI